MENKIQYLKWMIDNLPEEPDKRNRWIGFIQGALWSLNLVDINELRDETRKGNALENIIKILLT